MPGWPVLVLLLLVLTQLWRIEATLARLSQTQYRIVLKLGIDLDHLDAPSAAVRQLAQQPRMEIEAIRAYRKQTGADLKQARAVVTGLRSGSLGQTRSRNS